MADIAQHMNYSTLDNLSTTSRWDTDNAQWMNDSAMWHKNAAGILVPTGDTYPLPTKLSGSIAVIDTTPALNAVSITAGNYADAPIAIVGDEKEIYIEIIIDKQPWVISGAGTIWYANYDGAGVIYPAAAPQTSIAPSYEPKQYLIVGIAISHLAGETISSLSQAKEHVKYLAGKTINVRITNNHAADTATCTVNILRVRR